MFELGDDSPKQCFHKFLLVTYIKFNKISILYKNQKEISSPSDLLHPKLLRR